MRRLGTGLAGLAALVALVVALAPAPAGAAGSKKLVEGTVYDTTCATACVPNCPPPPHCGPITTQSRTDIVCAQRDRAIVCPLATLAPQICLQRSPCGGVYPIYSGEGALVNVRRRGSARVRATPAVVEGHFKIRLGPGEYVLHPYLPEEACWSGEATMVKVTRRLKSPVPATLDVSNRCIVHPDAGEVAARAG